MELSSGYGAVGNGVADDTAALRAAIVAAAGGRLIIPSGVYLVSGTLDIATGIEIEGHRATIRYASGTVFATARQPLMRVKPSSASIVGVKISGLVLDGNAAACQWAVGDEWSPTLEISATGALGVSRVLLTDLVCQGAQGDGITVRGDPTVENVPTDVRIFGCVIPSWMNSRQGIAVVGGERVTLLGNQIHNTNIYSSAIDIEPSTSANLCRGIAVVGNVITGNGGCGIAASNVPLATFSALVLSGNAIATTLQLQTSIAPGLV